MFQTPALVERKKSVLVESNFLQALLQNIKNHPWVWP